MKIRLLELCAGYGSQALALKNLGIDVYSEIAEFDKYASQAYMQLHGETKNYGDIYTIDETKLPYFDMITYSTPCQDFSVAGKGKGGDKGSGTRSSLLWECERIIRAVKPKFLLMENVKNILSDKHRHNFNEWFKVLEGMGYKNYYKVLNAKDFGIPQNRERIFCVSILGGGQYLFPNPIPLEKRLKDMLEDNVPEKYYLSDEQEKRFLQMRNVNPSGKGMNGNVCTGVICNTLKTNKGEGLKIKEITNTIRSSGRGTTLKRHDWDILIEAERTPLKFIDRNGKKTDGDYSFCVDTAQTGGVKEIYKNSYRIRKLTPRECWRLMGVKDEQFNRLKGISNTQLYKLAGNSIVVDVLEEIFRNLLMPETTDTKGQLSLF